MNDALKSGLRVGRDRRSIDRHERAAKDRRGGRTARIARIVDHNRIAGSGRAIAAIHIGRRRAIAGDRAAGDSHRAALRVDAGRAGDRAAGNGQVAAREEHRHFIRGCHNRATVDVDDRAGHIRAVAADCRIARIGNGAVDIQRRGLAAGRAKRAITPDDRLTADRGRGGESDRGAVVCIKASGDRAVLHGHRAVVDCYATGECLAAQIEREALGDCRSFRRDVGKEDDRAAFSRTVNSRRKRGVLRVADLRDGGCRRVGRHGAGCGGGENKTFRRRDSRSGKCLVERNRARVGEGVCRRRPHHLVSVASGEGVIRDEGRDIAIDRGEIEARGGSTMIGSDTRIALVHALKRDRIIIVLKEATDCRLAVRDCGIEANIANDSTILAVRRTSRLRTVVLAVANRDGRASLRNHSDTAALVVGKRGHVDIVRAGINRRARCGVADDAAEALRAGNRAFERGQILERRVLGNTDERRARLLCASGRICCKQSSSILYLEVLDGRTIGGVEEAAVVETAALHLEVGNGMIIAVIRSSERTIVKGGSTDDILAVLNANARPGFGKSDVRRLDIALVGAIASGNGCLKGLEVGNRPDFERMLRSAIHYGLAVGEGQLGAGESLFERLGVIGEILFGISRTDVGDPSRRRTAERVGRAGDKVVELARALEFNVRYAVVRARPRERILLNLHAINIDVEVSGARGNNRKTMPSLRDHFRCLCFRASNNDKATIRLVHIYAKLLTFFKTVGFVAGDELDVHVKYVSAIGIRLVRFVKFPVLVAEAGERIICNGRSIARIGGAVGTFEI